MAYETGRRAVELVREQLTPSKILTRAAFENAIVVASAIGGSTNAPPHINAIAAHAGVDLSMDDWDRVGYHIPLLANVQPAGAYLGEAFYRAGGVPAIVGELLAAGLVHGDPVGVSGRTRAEDYAEKRTTNTEVIRTVDDPFAIDAGMMVLHGNLFDSAVMKMSVISADFRERYLSDPDDPDAFIVTAVVFDGPEDYRARIDDPALDISERSILVVRNAGPVGYPGAAEVVNMTPPARLVRAGVRMLPCLGDGRQSGTSDSPSILNVSPEAAVGGAIGLLRDGDAIRVDVRQRTVTLLVEDAELAERRRTFTAEMPESHTPWEELYRAHVNQLADGATLEFATKYRATGRVIPRHSH